MNRRWPLIALAVAAAALLIGAVRLAGARVAEARATAAGEGTVADLARLREARARWRGVVSMHRPSGDLIGRVQQALAAAGLPIGACASVQPRGEEASQGGRARTQSVVVTLIGLTPGETGAFLAAFRANAAAWRVGDLQLAHQNSAPGDAAALDSNRFTVTVVLQATYVEESA
jgi:hypothetical protein